jgi:hypothetical protein
MGWLKATAVLTLVATSAMAEQSKDFGDYTIHFQAVPTEMLPAAVAREQGFVRSKQQWLLNVTVLKDNDATGVAVPAAVTVTARDLVGKPRAIALKKVDEGDTVYYIGTFRVTHDDLWRFALSATPEGSAKPLELTWEQRFDTL